MRDLTIIAALVLFPVAVLAKPTATIAPKDTSKFGYEWKKKEAKIGTGKAKELERNSTKYFVYQPENIKGQSGAGTSCSSSSTGAAATWTT